MIWGLTIELLEFFEKVNKMSLPFKLLQVTNRSHLRSPYLFFYTQAMFVAARGGPITELCVGSAFSSANQRWLCENLGCMILPEAFRRPCWYAHIKVIATSQYCGLTYYNFWIFIQSFRHNLRDIFSSYHTIVKC